MRAIQIYLFAKLSFADTFAKDPAVPIIVTIFRNVRYFESALYYAKIVHLSILVAKIMAKEPHKSDERSTLTFSVFTCTLTLTPSPYLHKVTKIRTMSWKKKKLI